MNDATAGQMRSLISGISWSDYVYSSDKLRGVFAWGGNAHGDRCICTFGVWKLRWRSGRFSPLRIEVKVFN